MAQNGLGHLFFVVGGSAGQNNLIAEFHTCIIGDGGIVGGMPVTIVACTYAGTRVDAQQRALRGQACTHVLERDGWDGRIPAHYRLSNAQCFREPYENIQHMLARWCCDLAITEKPLSIVSALAIEADAQRRMDQQAN